MEDVDFYLPCAIRACRNGVARVHLISRHVDGALLQELFTHEGIGTMVAEDMLETLRPATIDDVGGLSGADRTTGGRRHAGQALARTAGNGNRPFLGAGIRWPDHRLRRTLPLPRRTGG